MQNMLQKLNLKKGIYFFICLFTAICLSCTTTYAYGRKKIAKTTSDSMTLWSAYHYNYHFTSHAVLTYNSSNTITQISDLAFTNVGYTSSQPSLAANFIPKQLSKSNGGSQAKYVVQLTRSVYGYYTDKVNYTLTYKPSNDGVPYSVEDDNPVLVDIEVSEPYDVQILDVPPLGN